MKFKKTILFSLFGLGTIALVSTSSMLLSSCSSTSNPYASFTNVNATINGTKYSFKYNTNSTFTINENNTFKTTQDLYNNIFEIKDNKNEKIKLQPNMEEKYKHDLVALDKYKETIKKYNDTYIASQIYSYLSSFVNYFTQLLMKAQSYVEPVNINNYFDVTQWNEKQNSNNAKELMFATKFGSGEGYNVFGIWPKTIDLDFSFANNKTYTTPGNPSYSENQDPNPESIKINVNKFDVTYSWYKHEQVGGQYVTDLNTINNSLTSIQKQILKSKFGLDNISNIDYKLSLNTLASGVQFNYNPSVYEYTDPNNKTKTRIYSGLGLIGPEWINKNTSGGSSKDKWVLDIENQSPYKILNTSTFQTLKLVNSASKFFQGGLVNNKNYLPYRAYELIWKIGYFSQNQVKNDIDQKLFNDEVQSKESWFLNENNFYSKNGTNQEWTNLKNNPNYTNGILEIYKLFQIIN